MEKKAQKSFSLKWGLSISVAVCWIVPIAIIVTLSGYLLNLNYERHVRHAAESGIAYAMEQVQIRIEQAMEASKAVSYEGEIRQAYRQYEKDGNRAQLYRDVTDYLLRAYSRDDHFKAVFITFLDDSSTEYSYVNPKVKNSYGLLRQYRQEAGAYLLDLASKMDTGIMFRQIGQELYMIRNLMDSHFEPYGVLAMLCDKEVLFQSLYSVSGLSWARVTLDETHVPLTEAKRREPERDDRQIFTEYNGEADGHNLVFEGKIIEKNLWGAMPDLRWAVVVVTLLVVPLIVAAVLLFYFHVTRPVEALVEASNQVESGQRGYQIVQQPKSREFGLLTDHFNSMSKELKSQFDRIYLEQQSLQEARIKALQSQINPHFLGNTLEIINWEARLAENEKVSAMIEALSTMLDAAIGRDGRSLISLQEEITYIDAYLYIIQQRMGGGLVIQKEIDPQVLGQNIPRLILQPLVENAVEHDISHRRGAKLTIRAYRQDNYLYLEEQHDGNLTPEDCEKLHSLLENTGKDESSARVGVRNLNQRLHLIYGDKASFTVEQVHPGQILAQIRLPFASFS